MPAYSHIKPACRSLLVLSINLSQQTSMSQPFETVPQASEERHVKPSRMKRFVTRQPEQEEFLSLSIAEQLARVEANEKANKAKDEKAQAEKWCRQKGDDWTWWRGEWYWHEWELKERWTKPY